MPVYRDKHTKRLFIQFRLNGETYKERLPDSTTRKQAERIEVRVKSQMLDEQHGIETPRTNPTFGSFVKSVYLPYAEANHSKDSFDKAIHICSVAGKVFRQVQMRYIKTSDIEHFKQLRIALKTQHGTIRKPATIARELSIISKIFSLAVHDGIIDKNPCSKVLRPKFYNVSDKVLSYEDEQKMFARMQSPTARDVCKLVLHTGLRQNDVLTLTKFQVDLPNAKLHITQGKTKLPLDVKLNAVAYEIVARRCKRGSLLFPSLTGGVIRNGRIRQTMLRACTRAKIEPFTIRDLRRTFATRVMPFTDSVTASRLMGHADLRMIHRYQRNDELMQKAVDSLAPNAIVLPTAKIRKL